MDLNPGQQKLAFAVIVVILAGLGVYLLLPDTTAAPSAATPTVSPTAVSSVPAAPGTTVPQTGAAPPPRASSGVNIYQWLPFSQNDLANASSTAAQASGYYDTFSYKENAAVYGSRMSNLVTSQYLQVLESDYSTFGVARQRTSSKEISTASAVVSSLRSFGASSLTFVVTISQHIQQASGSTSPTGQYAVTVINSGGPWQVDQIQPASAGNQ